MNTQLKLSLFLTEQCHIAFNAHRYVGISVRCDIGVRNHTVVATVYGGVRTGDDEIDYSRHHTCSKHARTHSHG